jgi:hypothetical protein
VIISASPRHTSASTGAGCGTGCKRVQTEVYAWGLTVRVWLRMREAQRGLGQQARLRRRSVRVAHRTVARKRWSGAVAARGFLVRRSAAPQHGQGVRPEDARCSCRVVYRYCWEIVGGTAPPANEFAAGTAQSPPTRAATAASVRVGGLRAVALLRTGLLQPRFQPPGAEPDAAPRNFPIVSFVGPAIPMCAAVCELLTTPRRPSPLLPHASTYRFSRVTRNHRRILHVAYQAHAQRG